MKRLLVKVCGLTRPEDARLAAELGAEFLGFIFHPKSPRRAAPALPASLSMPLVLKVGVFVGQDLDETLRLMDAGRLNLAQLHGGQDEAFCEGLGRELGPERIIKVVWPEKAAGPEAFQAELDRFTPFCGQFLADAGGFGGGHGRVIGDQGGGVLAQARFPRPWLLAGGLGPENLCAALARFRPSGLDLNSGVESAPGVKDETKLRAAFAALACGENQ